MSEKAKRFMHLELGKDKREFICKIGDKPLKECIEEDINRYYINKKETRLINEEVLNCLKAILITCVGKSSFDFNAITSQIKIIVQDRNENEMEIVEMELFISLDEENELLVNKIKDCLKLYNITCIKNKDIIFTTNFKKKEGLGAYKEELLRIKEELESILGREISID